jgi:hypothetical protein
MASIFPLVTFVRLRNGYDSIAQRDSNFSMNFVCKSESNCFPIERGFSYAALYKFGELLGNYRVEKKSLSFGATFILQEVQLLARLHALGNDAVL